MAYEKVKFNTRSEWLENRVIGGSGAAAIIGENPWKTNVDYYQEMIKPTAKTPSNEKDDPSSVYWFGTHAEKPLREIFALAHYDEYEVIPPPSVETDGYIEMYVDTDYPFMTATPDGFVIDKATGQVLVDVSPDFYRPTDVVNLWGDPSKARTELGWNPTKTSFEELVRIMVEHDMQKVAAERAEEYMKCNLEEYLEKGVIK